MELKPRNRSLSKLSNPKRKKKSESGKKNKLKYNIINDFSTMSPLGQ